MWYNIFSLIDFYWEKEVTKWVIEDLKEIVEETTNIRLLAVGYERHPDRLSSRHWYLYYEGDDDLDILWTGDEK